jgi:glycosyltransferase involved in cell wall biosynthesis
LFIPPATPDGGGVGKRIFNESVWMHKNGHQIVIAAPENTPLFQKAKEYGFRVYAVSFAPMVLFNSYRDLIRIFHDEQPHVLNTHGDIDTKIAMPAAKKAGVPCRILSCTNSHVRNFWYNRRLYKDLSHYVFTTSGYTSLHLQAMFKLKNTRIFSIPGGILEPEALMPGDEARKALAAALGCDAQTRFAGYVGSLSKDRGLPTLLQAFKQVQSHICHHLVLVGGGPDEYKNRLMEMAQDLGIGDRTHFTGCMEDVWPVYRALDCKVLASEEINGIPFEGMPEPLLEAMYCSCPVIGSNTGGIPDIISHGITGLLFDPGDAGSLAKLLLETLHQEAATLERVHAARERVRQFHTMDAMGRDIIRIYRLHQVKLKRQQGMHQDDL